MRKKIQLNINILSSKDLINQTLSSKDLINQTLSSKDYPNKTHLCIPIQIDNQSFKFKNFYEETFYRATSKGNSK